MIVFEFLKQLKKKLRWKRRWLSLGIVILLFGAVFVLYKTYNFPAKGYESLGIGVRSAFVPEKQIEQVKQQEDILNQIKQSKEKKNTFIQKSYVCGEEVQMLGLKNAEAIQKLHQEHPSWIVSLHWNDNLQTKADVYFTQTIEDLSPKCKEKAYFGLDENGNLSLFDGLPGKDNVIRTFFQMNIHHLESSLPHDTVAQLHSGIRIKDLEEYNSVLSTFSDFAIVETERAMNPQ